MKRIWQLIFFATLCPVLYAGAQDLVPRREVATPTPAATPARSPETTPTPIPQSALALIPAPSATPAEAGTAASAPTMPDLSQLEQIFSKVTPGKEVELYRAHVEWRKLKNQTVNDPAVVEAKAAAEAATTDLEKRNRLRHYYELFYARMRALAPYPGDGHLSRLAENKRISIFWINRAYAPLPTLGRSRNLRPRSPRWSSRRRPHPSRVCLTSDS